MTRRRNALQEAWDKSLAERQRRQREARAKVKAENDKTKVTHVDFETRSPMIVGDTHFGVEDETTRLLVAAFKGGKGVVIVLGRGDELIQLGHPTENMEYGTRVHKAIESQARVAGVTPEKLIEAYIKLPKSKKRRKHK